MPLPNSLSVSAQRRHAHKPNGGAVEAICPYCGNSISRREFREIKARIEREEKARLGQVEATLKDRFAREMTQAQAKAKSEAERAKRDAAKTAEAQVKAVRASLDETISQRLAAQRESLGKQMADAIASERVKHAEERIKLTEQLADLQRRLESKTPHELGEPAEVDLFGFLEAAFTDDQVSRVTKGQRGPDIVIEVYHHEAAVGSIIIEVKNHAKWSSRFVEKLKADQRARGADFAILSSTTFPKGARQLHVDEGIIIADPARIVALVQLLRRHLIQNHVLRLGAEARNEKAHRLLEYMLSAEAGDLFSRLEKAADSLLNLDMQEVTTHQSGWRKRGELIRDVQRVHEDFQTALSTICGTEARPQEALL